MLIKLCFYNYEEVTFEFLFNALSGIQYSDEYQKMKVNNFIDEFYCNPDE